MRRSKAAAICSPKPGMPAASEARVYVEGGHFLRLILWTAIRTSALSELDLGRKAQKCARQPRCAWRLHLATKQCDMSAPATTDAILMAHLFSVNDSWKRIFATQERRREQSTAVLSRPARLEMREHAGCRRQRDNCFDCVQ